MTAITWPADDTYPELPWNELAVNPGKFFELMKFSELSSLAKPSSLSQAALFSLANYLKDISTSQPLDPLVFRLKEEIIGDSSKSYF